MVGLECTLLMVKSFSSPLTGTAAPRLRAQRSEGSGVARQAGLRETRGAAGGGLLQCWPPDERRRWKGEEETACAGRHRHARLTKSSCCGVGWSMAAAPRCVLESASEAHRAPPPPPPPPPPRPLSPPPPGVAWCSPRRWKPHARPSLPAVKEAATR
jgi:hypothetical protein